MHQLLGAALFRRHRKRGQRTGVTVAAQIQAAVQHDPTTDEIAEIEIGKVLQVATAAEQKFRCACRRGVVAEMNGPGEACGNFGLQVETLPGHQHIGRCAHILRPVPEFEWCGDAHAADPSPLFRCESRHELLDARGHESDHLGRRREGVGPVDGVPHVAGKVHQHQVARAPTHLEPDRECTVGIELEWNQWLANLAALRGAPPEQAIRLELTHDHRHRLGRKAGKARHLGLRQLTVQPDERQDEALIVEPDA